MITDFKDFKHQMNESVQPSVDPAMGATPEQVDHVKKLEQCCKIAIKCGLNKEQTFKVLEAFTDAAKAPEEINVNFVKDNLQKLQECLQIFDNNEFLSINFSDVVLESKTPFELVVSVPSNPAIIKLYDSLLNNISKQDFKVEYFHDVFYINNMNILNEHNKKVVLDTLKSVGAVNIATQLKWARIIA